MTLDFRLGVIAGDVAARNSDGQVLLNFSIGRLLEQIRRRIPDTRVCLPVVSTPQADMNYSLQFPGTAITELPPLRSTLESQAFYLQTSRILQRFAQSVDLLLIRLPFQLPLCLRNLGKPKLLQVASNPCEIVRVSTDYGGPMKILARRFALHSMASMRRLIAEDRTRVVTNGKELWDLLKCRNGKVIISSAILSHEMKPRTSFALGNPPRLLFIGYLRPEKGVETLLDAFTQIRRHRPLKLTLVGGTDRATGAEGRIQARIEENPYRNDIVQKGMIHFGEPLFDLYRTHDLFVLPSLSEGTPRTLVEARGFGCPVVATSVGGVPSSVTNDSDGLLVPPNNPEAMAASIVSILDDEKLRLRLIEQGLVRTRAYTLERFAEGMIDELRLLHDDISQENMNHPSG
ncbi:MAG: glycosyl transferase group 1 [Acidobacteria bacterium]|nr:glycosyl transferase group 1 [Acidobacteriota bacterium]